MFRTKVMNVVTPKKRKEKSGGYLAHEDEVREVLLVEHFVRVLLDVPVRGREVVSDNREGEK